MTENEIGKLVVDLCELSVLGARNYFDSTIENPKLVVSDVEPSKIQN